MTLTAAQVFRDYETDGDSSSGAHKVLKSDIRSWGAVVDAITPNAATFLTTENYSGSITNTRMMVTLGTDLTPDVTQDSAAIFQKIGSSTSTGGKNATVYISARKRASGADQGQTALFAEGQDDVGGAGSFIEGIRGHAVLAAGIGGNGTGVIGIGIAPASSAYELLAGFEGQLFNDNADATTAFNALAFEAPFLASNAGSKKSFAGFMVNTFNASSFLYGFYVPAAFIGSNSVSDSAFRADAALVNGVDLSRGSYSGSAIKSPGFSVDGSGAVRSSSPTSGIGYGTGAGGTVAQATNKSTGVTLNTVTGAITMNGAALAAGTIVSFVLTDSAIAATDVLALNHVSGGTPGAYTLNAQAGAGAATINVRNNTAGSLSEAIVIEFAVIKGVTS